jgi:sarcosine oxidase subunit gamma
MAESYLRQGPLDHLRLAARTVAERGDAGVSLRERLFRVMVTLRGDADDPAFTAAVETALGAKPSAAPLTVAIAKDCWILWLGPDEWLVVAAPEAGGDLAARLEAALAGIHAAVIETGESMTVIELAGPHARDVLAKGCTIDLHPRAFAPGRVVRTLVAKAGVILLQIDDAPVYELYVHRSHADYLWRWLEDAGLEYGVAILDR